MHPVSKKGNRPELWEKLLESLDEKLQLGLLDYLRRISSYHFEDDVLTIQTGSPEDADYLAKPAVLQHLELLAEDATGVRRVKVQKP